MNYMIRVYDGAQVVLLEFAKRYQVLMENTMVIQSELFITILHQGDKHQNLN